MTTPQTVPSADVPPGGPAGGGETPRPPVLLAVNAVLLLGLVITFIGCAVLAFVVPMLFGPLPGLCSLVVVGPVAGLLYQSTFRRSLSATKASTVVYATGAVLLVLGGLGMLGQRLTGKSSASGEVSWYLLAAVAALSIWCAVSWLKSVQWAGDLYAHEHSCELEGPPVARETREGAHEE